MRRKPPKAAIFYLIRMFFALEGQGSKGESAAQNGQGVPRTRQSGDAAFVSARAPGQIEAR
jgi:hypothetical protein